MFVLDWKQDRPAFEDSRRIWDVPVFAEKIEESVVPSEWLNEVRTIYVNGGAEFASFSVSDDRRLDWFVSRNRLNEIDFIENFLTSEALRNALPKLQAPQKIESIKCEWSNPYVLDGELAHILKSGGAYESYKGSGAEAKAVGQRACCKLFGDRYDDLSIFKTYTPWSPWFHDIAWDCTWVGVDKAIRSAWVLCVTDTD